MKIIMSRLSIKRTKGGGNEKDKTTEGEFELAHFTIIDKHLIETFKKLPKGDNNESERIYNESTKE